MANIGGFVSGAALLDRRREVLKLSAKVQSIDDLLAAVSKRKPWLRCTVNSVLGKPRLATNLP